MCNSLAESLYAFSCVQGLSVRLRFTGNGGLMSLVEERSRHSNIEIVTLHWGLLDLC